MQNKIKKVIIILAILTPSVSFGDYLDKTTNIAGRFQDLIEFLLIPTVFSLALLLFFWGVLKYIKSEGDGKEEGKKIMIWGVVALFVMASIWGLVRFIQDNFSLRGDSDAGITVPKINN